MPAEDTGKESKHVVPVAEMEHREGKERLADHGRREGEPPELGNSVDVDGAASAEPNRASRNVDQPTTQEAASLSQTSPSNPLPSAFELYPIPGTKETEAEDETDFEYQARRLQERRSMIAERKRLAEEEEQIAMEEEALRQKKAAKGGRM